MEEFKILVVNRAHRAIAVFNLSIGGTAGTIADPTLIFACALKANAAGIVLAHNHPSGNLVPSEADKELTKRLVLIGNYLQIQLLEHIILLCFLKDSS